MDKPTRISIEFPNEESAMQWFKTFQWLGNSFNEELALFQCDALLDKAMANKWVVKSKSFNGFAIKSKSEESWLDETAY